MSTDQSWEEDGSDRKELHRLFLSLSLSFSCLERFRFLGRFVSPAAIVRLATANDATYLTYALTFTYLTLPY